MGTGWSFEFRTGAGPTWWCVPVRAGTLCADTCSGTGFESVAGAAVSGGALS